VPARCSGSHLYFPFKFCLQPCHLYKLHHIAFEDCENTQIILRPLLHTGTYVWNMGSEFFFKVKAPYPLLRIGVVDPRLGQCHRASLCARLPGATYFQQNRRTVPLKTAMAYLSARKTKSSIVSLREQIIIC
jgi:hypothetical protein